MMRLSLRGVNISSEGQQDKLHFLSSLHSRPFLVEVEAVAVVVEVF